MNKVRFLSYILDSSTPTYGNRNQFLIEKKSDISKGDVANDSFISTTVHIGTHIDMPYHFYENGQTIEDFNDDFWVFNRILFVEIEPRYLIIQDELIEKLSLIKDDEFEILIVKTGICDYRDEEKFWNENYGFSPEIYDYIVKKFSKVRVLGFDSISVSSFRERMIGKKAHKRFLNPDNPILLLEDMDLKKITKQSKFEKLVIAPLRIKKCDGLPCTVIGFFND